MRGRASGRAQISPSYASDVIAVLAPRGTTRLLHAASVSLFEEPWRRGVAGRDAWPLTGLDVHTIRVNHKKVAGKSSPFRNQQFEYINRTRRRFERQGWPAISIDTKKRELVGRLKTAGTT